MAPGHPSSLSLLPCYPICILPCQGDIKEALAGLGQDRAQSSERFCLRRLAGLGDESFELGHPRADEPLAPELLTG